MTVLMLGVLMRVMSCRLRGNGGVHAAIVSLFVGELSLVVGRWSLANVVIKHASRTTNDCLAVNYGRAVMPLPPSNREARLLRFGVFEVDLDAGELRKNGARIRLQEQPFQVLSALLQNAGQVVTRDQLREKIWPADTFVDFDHSLNTAVNKIRESLGDSASSPRFVETLARRGYRFIASVDSVAAPATLSTPHAQDDNDPTTSAAEITLHPQLHVPVPRRGLVRALFALIQAMYLIFYVSGLAHLRDADRVASSFLPGWRALSIVGAILVTGAVGIPLRFYLLSAVAFDFRKLAATFGRLFPFVLALDQLWAIAPFLLLPQIGVGLAFAATAALLYVPFSERTLVRMAYPLEN
ncbi:MAG: winged helix-turn-helix domain-containing protein [Terriglobales bacterium]|jgi:DNA-binding winged helix-turn-helix (wHTH) protein